MQLSPLDRFQQTLTDALDDFAQRQRPNLANWLHGYMLILILAGLVFQLYVPIEFHDSDMWYHLHSGDRFWETGQIPNNSFFSFIQPERSFVNYYWGFQALISKVYEYSGYQGLLILRSLLFFLTTFVAYRFIVEAPNVRSHMILATLLFAAYFILIEGRVINLRPHLFSHLFILLFLYILERRQRWAPLLPAITALWSNLHGIEWVIPALIGGAYLIDYYVERPGAPSIARDWRYPASILACAPAVLLTPHGLELLSTPFQVAPFVTLYIAEMRPLDSSLFHTIVFSGDNPRPVMAFTLLFLATCYAFLRELIKRQIRVSHAILTVAAFILLLKGTRFLWEWAFLVLPLLSHALSATPRIEYRWHPLSLATLLIAVLLALPFIQLIKKWPGDTPYPLNHWSLPHESVSFLLRTSPQGGNLFAPPSEAGYFHYALGNRFKIFADLQMSLFDDRDIFSLFGFYKEKIVTNRLLKQYPIDFLLVPRLRTDFPKRLNSHPEFKPVFIGDSMIVYANEESRPQLVEKFQLQTLRPYDPANVEDLDIEQALSELKHMLRINPNNRSLLHAITRILSNEERYREAAEWSRRFIASYPTEPNAYFLLGDALRNLGQCRQAIPLFKKGQSITSKSSSRSLEAYIGSCYADLEDYEPAYDHFRKGLNPFTTSVDTHFLSQWALSAFFSGHNKEAMELFDILILSLNEDQSSLRNKAISFKKLMEAAERNRPSFIKWLWQQIRGNAASQ